MGKGFENNNRDSNIELLRIVCMLFILMHHFIVHVFCPELVLRDGDLGLYRAVCVIINGFVYVGVNCFILISGYYGIKFKWKSLFNLYCICAFYALLVVLERCLWQHSPFDKGMLYSVLLPFSHTEWWFISCYVALFLLSPLLNKAIEVLDRQQFVLIMLLLTILNVYFGYYWHQHNVNGYNLLNFVFVYFIGAFLHKFPLKKLDRRRSMLLYVVCSMLWSILTFLSVRWRVPHWNPLHYNNPVLILSSIGLFVFITTHKISNPRINALASGVLAAYLIQDVAGGLIYSFSTRYKNFVELRYDTEGMRIASMLVFVALGSMLVLLLALAIDRVRVWLMQPVWKMYGMVENKWHQRKSFRV